MNHPRVRRTARLLLTGLLAGMAAVAQPQDAQAQDTKGQARDHAERGTRLYEVGKYVEAIEEYQKAYELGGDPVILYNIAQAYRLADQPTEAIRFYKNYLRREPGSKYKDAVEKRIAELEKVVEERKRTGAPPTPPAPPGGGPTTIPPTNTPPDPTTPPAGTPPVPPGSGAQTYPPYSTAPPPGSGQPPNAAPPYPTGPVGPAPPAPPPPPQRVERRSRVVPLSIMGVGGALLAVSIVEGVVAAGHAKTVSDASKDGRVFDPSIEKKGKTASAISIVTGLGGLVALGVGGWMLISRRDETTGPGGATAAVAPVVTPDLIGAQAAVRF